MGDLGVSSGPVFHAKACRSKLVEQALLARVSRSTLWSEVNRCMWKQEANWESSRRETRKAYLARLRRIAMRLPADFLKRSIEDMRRRCLRLEAAGGKHFHEGA